MAGGEIRASLSRLLVLGLALSLALLGGLDPLAAAAQRIEPGGAPPPGSGPIDVRGYVRVIDGRTIETYIEGKRVGIRLLDIETPSRKTECGQQAIARLQKLVKNGVRLEEDPSRFVDARMLRLYHVKTRDGASIAEQMLAEGLARRDSSSGDGRLVEAEARGQAANGCAWRVPGRRSSTPMDDQVFASVDLSALAPGPDVAARPLGVTVPTVAATLPGGFVEELVAAGLREPTNFAFLPDGRILIAEKRGVVRVVKNGSLLATPFIDISDHVNDYWDRGLLAVAVDPSFDAAAPGPDYVYLLYTYENDADCRAGLPSCLDDAPKTARLSRVTASGDTASPSTETVILGTVGGDRSSPSCDNFPIGSDCIVSDSPSHSGGGLQFAPDGSLFVTLGDGANFNFVDDDALRAQNLDILAGKVLRITTAGSGLADNPFWNGNAGANRSKVWGYGLRNAFRFAVRPGSGPGVPYLGDVGWNDVEELNAVIAGANLGWPCYEGPARQAGYEPKPLCQALYGQGSGAVRAPLFSYSHDGQGAAAVGGAFYSGTSFPSAYQGAYFFGDYARGWVRYAKVDASHQLVDGPFDFAADTGAPVALTSGSDGNLYYVSFALGELRRVTASSQPPITGTRYLSDLAWLSSTNGWGPAERDQSNGEQAAGDGRPLTIGGTTFQKGIGTHSYSEIRVLLGGACSTFTAQIGLDDEVGSEGTVIFQVWADGAKLFDSGTVTGADSAKPVNVAVSGRSELKLVVTDAGDNIWFDHADWADAKVVCGSGDTDPPTVSAVSPPAGATGVQADANVTATFSEGMDASSLNTTTFTLVPQGSSTPVPASVTYQSSTRTATLDPSANLTLGATYTATIKGGSGGARDSAGNALATDYTWTFTVAASPNTPPVPAISAPTSDTKFAVGEVISYAGSATDTQDGALPPSALTWTIHLHHCPQPTSCHLHPFTTTTGAGGTFTVPDHGDGSYFEIILTATDRGGLTGSTSVTIQPRMAPITLNTSPAGLQVVFNGSAATAPLTRDAIVGSTFTIYSPSPQGTATFSSWSDGGAQQHNVTAPAGGAAFTATFTTPPSDTTPPTVISHSPPSGATGVSASSGVTATFSEAMNAATINTSTFILTRQGTTTPVSATVAYDAASRVATLDPTADLQAGAQYTATVKGGSSGVRDLAGNPLASDQAWSFTVASGVPTSCPTGQFLAQYWNNRSLSGTPVLVRCESGINYEWGGGSPAPGVNADDFSVRWTGRFTFGAATYRFVATADDGVRVFVDGARVINGWKDQPPTVYSKSRSLAAGEHEIRMDFYERAGGATAKLSWQVSGSATGNESPTDPRAPSRTETDEGEILPQFAPTATPRLVPPPAPDRRD